MINELTVMADGRPYKGIFFVCSVTDIADSIGDGSLKFFLTYEVAKI